MELNENLEIERKYIIEKPDESDIEAIKSFAGVTDYNVSEIEQIYLFAIGRTHRVRRRSWDSETRYYETLKLRVDKMSAVESEREITREEYLALSKNIRPGSRPISKVRHYFKYNGQPFEIDVYPFWKRTAILELELVDRGARVEFLPLIRVIREVTGDKRYSNSALADSPVPESENVNHL